MSEIAYRNFTDLKIGKVDAFSVGADFESFIVFVKGSKARFEGTAEGAWFTDIFVENVAKVAVVDFSFLAEGVFFG